MGYMAKIAYFWPKWPYCRGLKDHIEAYRDPSSNINTSNDSPRHVLYANIYSCVPSRGSHWHRKTQSCLSWPKNRFWGKSDCFYPKNALFRQKTAERWKCAEKTCLSCFNDFFALATPTRISNEHFESRRIKLETPSGLRIFGAKFCVFFQSQKTSFQPLLPQKGHIWPNLHLKISPQKSEAPMGFRA